MNIVLALVLFALQSISQPPVILAIGDSITAGYGVASELSYPAQLEKELQKHGYAYRVINQGVTASTTVQAAGRLTRALALQPEVVLIQLGGNDRAQGIPKDVSIENIRRIIQRFKPGGARIFFAGGRFPYLDKAAAEEGAQVIPFLDGVEGHPELLLNDGAHPTGEGHAVIARNLLKALEPFLRKSSLGSKAAGAR